MRLAEVDEADAHAPRGRRRVIRRDRRFERPRSVVHWLFRAQGLARANVPRAPPRVNGANGYGRP
jgi:hypothetical protein